MTSCLIHVAAAVIRTAMADDLDIFNWQLVVIHYFLALGQLSLGEKNDMLDAVHCDLCKRMHLEYFRKPGDEQHRKLKFRRNTPALFTTLKNSMLTTWQ